MQSLTKNLRCVYIPLEAFYYSWVCMDGLLPVSHLFSQLPALIALSLTLSLSLSGQLRLSLERRTSLPRGPPLTAPGTLPAPRPQSRHWSASTLS